MKALQATGLAILLALYLTTYPSTQAEEGTTAKLMKVSQRCRQKYNVTLSYLESAIDNRTLLHTEQGRDYVRCLVIGVGVFEAKKIIGLQGNANQNASESRSSWLHETIGDFISAMTKS
ncbi:Hypothetical protein NTJ_13646 [Nesidiocoris tenuis]|uniref:Uncharacterized protein n=1 Tax=Nesidiocoris tenuis TaxID=355587 RepID=A0ABN7BB30_9HEMI|nr:Hypothetical protein NTJ_13646 [Nesidiocoris tenuis]